MPLRRSVYSQATLTLFAPAKSFSIGAEAPPAFSAAPHRIWSKHPGWRCQYCPPSQFVVALVYHAESLWRKSPKALCIFCFGTFRAATKFSLIFSLMASKFNHTVRQHLTARFLSKPLLPTLSGISQHDTKSPCDNSSPASRTSKERHPFGYLFSCPSHAKRRRFRVSFQAVEKAVGFSRQPEIMPLFSCRFAARKYSLRSTHALQSKA